MKEETEDAITKVYDTLIVLRDETADPVVLELIAHLLESFADWEESFDE